MWAYGTQLRPWSPPRPLRWLTLFPYTFNMKLSSHLTWLISPLLMAFLWGFLSHLDDSTYWLFHYYRYLSFNIFNSTLELLIIEKGWILHLKISTPDGICFLKQPCTLKQGVWHEEKGFSFLFCFCESFCSLQIFLLLTFSHISYQPSYIIYILINFHRHHNPSSDLLVWKFFACPVGETFHDVRWYKVGIISTFSLQKTLKMMLQHLYQTSWALWTLPEGMWVQ